MMQNILTRIAREAGDLAMTHFGKLGDGAIASKGPLDLVTVADRAVEALIARRLREAFPQDGFLGEEDGIAPGSSGRIWVVDPIDGTFNFVRGGSQWSISIGLWDGARPICGVVYAPVADLMLIGGDQIAPMLNGRPLAPLTRFDPAHASVGFGLGGARFPLKERLAMLGNLMGQAKAMVRVGNSATHGLIEVATGEADAYVCYGESAWDVMAMWPILTALGATASLDWSVTPLDARLRLVIGKPDVVALVAPFIDPDL